MKTKDIEIKVETQTFRFIPRIPVQLEDAVSIAGGSSNGEFAVVGHENPRATIIIDSLGSVIIHGISNKDVAKLITEEFLLSIGLPESGLKIEMGELVVSFSLGRAVLMQLASERFSDIQYDERLDAIRIKAERYKCDIIVFNNGRGIVLNQTSQSVIEMAIEHWTNQLVNVGALA